MILSTFVNQQIFKNIGAEESKDIIYNIINNKTYNTLKILSENSLFNSIRNKIGDKKEKANTEQIIKIICKSATSPLDRYAKSLGINSAKKTKSRINVV